MTKYLYRLSEVHYAPPLDEDDNPVGEGRIEVIIKAYEIIKETKCGAWVKYDYDKKFVNLQARKKFACVSIDDAMESMIARKQRQLQILQSRARDARRVINIVNNQSFCKDIRYQIITGGRILQ